MHDQPNGLRLVQGLPREGEAAWCDHCGGPVFRPFDPSDGQPTCERCEGKLEGFDEALVGRAYEDLERVIEELTSLTSLAKAADMCREVTRRLHQKVS